VRIVMLLHKSVEFDSRVRREAGALAAAGHQVTVLELAPVPPDRTTLDGFHRRSVAPSPFWRRVLPFGAYRILFLFAFLRGVNATHPDAVHAHDAAMLLPGALGARLTGARLVYDSHELATGVAYRQGLWAWFVGALERMIVPRCAAVITVSDGIATRMRERYGLASTPLVVRNVSALGTGGTGGLRRRLGVGTEASVVLHQGAPAPARGCEVLVAAVARIEDVNLVFLGDPEPGYGERLEQEIERRGLTDRVAMLPSVPLTDLLAYTAEADVGITLLQDTCENHRLALPNKLFEYIAAGVPVIASALPETQRLVEGYGIGWCVAPAQDDRLAEALRDAIESRNDPALGARLARARDELRWGREQARLLGLYEWLAGG
jgi:glycosyltransferase involved in cell wall biosynthesis